MIEKRLRWPSNTGVLNMVGVGKEGEKMNKINFFHPQYLKAAREKDLGRSGYNSKNGIHQPLYSCNRLGCMNIDQDWLYLMCQLLFIQYYVFCLDWKANELKNALWLWNKLISKKPEEYQWLTTSFWQALSSLCRAKKSGHNAMKGYMFNLPWEEDKSMMQKLHDRCDNNKYLAHFQS